MRAGWMFVTLVACGPSPSPVPAESPALAERDATPATDRSTDEPPASDPPALEEAEPPPDPSATEEPEPPPPEQAEPAPVEGPQEACPEPSTPRGFETCRAAELTGEAPCESICWRPRKAKRTKCCEDPVDVVVFRGKRQLLRLAACSFVPPDCAHVHGHGNMDARLRVLDGSPPDVIFVEGGCEMRASMHGYVPDGVAAWSGCEHQRFRWNGKALVRRKGED